MFSVEYLLFLIQKFRTVGVICYNYYVYANRKNETLNSKNGTKLQEHILWIAV